MVRARGEFIISCQKIRKQLRMRLYLIRHGQTQWNLESRCQGFSDTTLTELGLKQAQAIGEHLKDKKVHSVHSSTLSRAQNTARIVASFHNLEINCDPDLRELNQGELEGLNSTQLREKHSALLKEWFLKPASLVIRGGESLEQVQARAWEAIGRIANKEGQGDAAVVSHNLTILTILCKVLDLPLTHFRRLKQDVAAINTLEFTPSGPTIISLNDTCHLEHLNHID